MISPSVDSTDTAATAGAAQPWPSVTAPRNPRYDAAITTPEMASAVCRERRAIHTVTGTCNATTSTVLATNTAAAQTADACSTVTRTNGSATSGTLRQNTKMTFAARSRPIRGAA